jgi:DNA-binding response OmpR family regulator
MAETDARPGQTPLRGARILLVEDHVDSAEAMITVMEGARYRVRWATTAAAAIEAFGRSDGPERRDEPDLILLDLTLPDKSGVELVEELRRTKPRVPPIVVISAKPVQALKDDARAIRAAGLLRKPFGIRELLSVLGNIEGRASD